jgi:hypothetical protein
MFLARIVATGFLLTASVFALVSDQDAQPPPAQENSQSGSQAGKQTQPTNHSKPCTNTSQSGPSASSNCNASTKGKSKKHSAAKSSNAGNKTVVRNGGTAEPSVDIAPSQDPKQAARIQETHRLLAAADLNLKDVAVRGMDSDQQAAVKQIRSFMDQAKAAESSGDVERAYNLANKANMLAADLNGQH